jgi:2,3-dihydroxy-p-cumate/2,3-dihydroxybenzoate 3,4-dioxygenase
MSGDSESSGSGNEDNPKIRYRKLGYVELNVSDLARSRDFYEGLMGLQFVEKGPSGELRFRCSEDPYTVVLHKGTPGHKRTGWMLENEQQFDNLFRRLAAANVPFEEVSWTECAERGIARAARMVDPNFGALFEFYLSANSGAHEFKPTVADIQRLGHVVFTSPDFQETIAFYRDVMNFAISDFVGGIFAFLRCWPNPFHHGMGIGGLPHRVYHHTNFMVTEIDDIGKAIHRFNRAGVPIVYGPGRHPASGSAFLYFLDPDGLTCEYSFGMERFPETGAREPRQFSKAPESADSWLSPLDPRMGRTGVIERYEIKSATGMHAAV